ncbi:hypothetical protein EON67_08230 [archaeon]|nr:MAG: hypothetical protein EON67_08230 [archaeon]
MAYPYHQPPTVVDGRAVFQQGSFGIVVYPRLHPCHAHAQHVPNVPPAVTCANHPPPAAMGVPVAAAPVAYPAAYPGAVCLSLALVLAPAPADDRTRCSQ